MRLLLMLNESSFGAHSDWHLSLSNLKSQHILDSYYIYPYPARFKDGLSKNEVLQEIVSIGKKELPTMILWNHTGSWFINDEAFSALKNLPSKPSIGYWDGDVWQKPITAPKNLIHLGARCDVAFCQGVGDLVNMLKKAGCKDIRYVAATSDEPRFFKLRPKDYKIKYDVVMIGNKVTSLLPWRTAPGSRWREKIAKKFFKELGPRFAMFGLGWPESYGKGPINFNDQMDVYHSSRIALGTNNWLGPKYYFSNRLPIAMSSGVPVVYNYEEGFNEMFNKDSNVFFFKSTEEAWEICSHLLKKTQEELDQLGMGSYKYAKEHFDIDKMMIYIVETLKAHKNAKDNNTNLMSINNPWISSKTL